MNELFNDRTPFNKGKKLPAEPLTADEVRLLIRACSMRAHTGVRNRALLVTMYRAGLRAREAITLMPKDLDVANGSIRVLHGKGGKSRFLGLDAGALGILQVWMDRREILGLNNRQPFFCSLKGHPLQTSYLRALMPRLGQRAGIEKRVHPHGLRHTFSYELAGEGVPVHEIQCLLGHACLTTTTRYLSHLHPATAVARMRGREWSL